MYDCEICGKKTESLYIIDVEDAELTTCGRCAEGKSIIEIIEDDKKNNVKMQKSSEKEQEDSIEIIDDYGAVIRNARDKIGIPIKVLAEMINEKESMLNRVEHGKMLPSDKLIDKLEKNLGIKLKVSVSQGSHIEKKGNDPKLTLGDAAIKK